ncbi:restriction endonuclease subunit S [Edwardsiella ictaluri]|uniref:restriction endonuclease subunit S n=1 Tax=Edwardsiella ictaluri TaxID=67780 RepID=UPI0009C06834|nr:restriction endonuclease subunit S [Edwardsiella ictaluri]ARD40597.1 restriction endonuclease [Edwardsiella ictaluri]QPW26144.1 restriction endonuclease subunit S [Edwardsiella ictaluri]
MGRNWVQAKLGDYIDTCLGKMLDKNKNTGEYHPYLGNSNVRWGSFDLDALSEMKFEAHEHERYGIKKGDLIICEGGEPGRCAIWEDNIQNMKIQKALHRVRTLPGLDSEYLYYWFLFSTRAGRIDPFFTGTTIKHLTGKALKEIPILIPPLEYQQDAARLLRGFDKKITLNRQINQTLEQMVQALFKSWFVDFDPVVDNALDAGFFEQNSDLPEALLRRAEQRKVVCEHPDFTPLPAETRQLFPAAFEACDEPSLGLGGWVPQGWGYLRADEVADITIGKTPPRKENEWFSLSSDNNYSWVSIKDLGSFGVYTGITNEYLTSDAVEKFNVKKVPMGSVILSFKLTLGRVAIASKELVTNEAVAHFSQLKQHINEQYLYLYLKDFNYDSLGSTSSIASAVNSKIIKSMPVLVPNSQVLVAFKELTLALFNRMQAVDDEVLSLTQIRDTLLPKLISGELRLKDNAPAVGTDNND